MKKYILMFVNVIVYLAILQLFTVIVSRLWWSGKIIPMDIAMKNYIFIFLIVFSLTILAIGIIYKFRGKNLIKVCNFNKISAKNFGLTLAIGVLMGIFTSCVCNTSFISKNIPIFKDYLFGSVNGSSSFIVFLIVIAVMFSCEEIIFRGIIFNEFLPNVPLAVAVILSTAVYGIINILTIHVAVGMYALVAALFFTLAYIFANSMFAPMILQIASIYVIAIVIKTGSWDKVKELGDGVLISVVALTIISMMSIYYIMYKSYKNNNKTKKAIQNN